MSPKHYNDVTCLLMWSYSFFIPPPRLVWECEVEYFHLDKTAKYFDLSNKRRKVIKLKEPNDTIGRNIKVYKNICHLQIKGSPAFKYSWNKIVIHMLKHLEISHADTVLIQLESLFLISKRLSPDTVLLNFTKKKIFVANFKIYKTAKYQNVRLIFLGMCATKDRT